MTNAIEKKSPARREPGKWVVEETPSASFSPLVGNKAAVNSQIFFRFF